MYFLGEKMECMKDYKIIYGHNNILMRKILFFKVRKHYTFKQKNTFMIHEFRILFYLIPKFQNITFLSFKF